MNCEFYDVSQTQVSFIDSNEINALGHFRRINSYDLEIQTNESQELMNQHEIPLRYFGCSFLCYGKQFDSIVL